MGAVATLNNLVLAIKNPNIDPELRQELAKASINLAKTKQRMNVVNRQIIELANKILEQG